jgi:hypothetical protein
VCQSYFAFILSGDSASPTRLIEASRGLPFYPVAAEPSDCVRVFAPLSGFAPQLKVDATTHRAPNSEGLRE